MSKPKIGVILGSTREGRFGDKPAKWILDLGKNRPDVDLELIDLRDFPMPFFGEPGAPQHVGPAEEASAWRKTLARYDGFIFIVAEYNHAPTGVLKNAIDLARVEWARKPVAYVGYGGVGGARAVQQLKQIAIEQQMAPVKSAVHILFPDYMAVAKGTDLASMDHINQAAVAMLDDLSWWTNALKSARENVETVKAAA
ncbi:NAD(P)H-dependent oxidoreductase [Salmonella enterica subsp. enterica]|nr:NAD(P)H-dependent oxidoreductase [Salmonella enterica subsp. enterica serovar Newport]ECI7685936.1 NAD(P)H-dependent oxidoreductase [Salmonella enterica subsp. enterica serovar Paratyphi A]